MDREIKFRAFGQKAQTKIMFDVKKLDFVAKIIVVADLETNPCYLKMDEAILMQYTGKDDKNGKEIYEGDVIKYHHGEDIGIVKFGKFISHDRYDCGETEMLGYYVQDRYGRQDTLAEVVCEIIGNIYENPELLEQKNG